MVKSNSIGFLLDPTQQYTSVLFGKAPIELLLENELVSSHCAAYSGVAGMCISKWCMLLHHTLVNKDLLLGTVHA